MDTPETAAPEKESTSHWKWGLAVVLVFPMLIWIVAKGLGLVAHFILQPIKDASEKVTVPAQFSIFDFVSLLILIQIALAYALRFNEGGTRAFFPQLVLYFLIASVALWSAGVSLLSRIGIREPARRGVFVVVLLPWVVIALAGVLLTPMAWFMANDTPADAQMLFSTVSGTNISSIYLLIGGTLFVMTSPFLLRWLAAWVVAPTLQEALRQTNSLDDPPANDLASPESSLSKLASAHRTGV